MTGATDVISKLEKASVTKEILEATRIGAAVNDLRKRSQLPAPELSKRCRALIKLWQKLVERPPSSCGSSTSRGGTPRTPFTPASAATQAALVSPAVRLLSKLTPPAGVRSQPVTPGAHAKQRVLSSTGAPSKPSDNGRGNISPAWTSSYAPPQLPSVDRIASPANGTKQAKALPKSMSVGAELARKGVSPEGAIRLTIKVGSGASTSTSTVVSTALASPGAPPPLPVDAGDSPMRLSMKRKADHNQNEALVNGSKTSPSTKRVKTTPSPPVSVLSSRQKVLPTATLVAQMSEDLPEHMTIDLRAHEHKVRGEQLEQEEAEKNVFERRKEREDRLIDKEHRKREKEARREERRRHKVTTTNVRSSMDGPPTQEALKTDLVHKFLESSLPSTSTGGGGKPSWEPLMPAGKPRDWYASLPPLDFSLLNDVSVDQPPSMNAPLAGDLLRHRSVLHGRDRQVLGLPYVDIGLPDFVEYSFPDKRRYLAEENFVFGRPRPDVQDATTSTSSSR